MCIFFACQGEHLLFNSASCDLYVVITTAIPIPYLKILKNSITYLLNIKNISETYKSRNRRDSDLELISERAIDISLAEKQILSELGPKACILEEPCRIHANRKARTGAEPEWGNILR